MAIMTSIPALTAAGAGAAGMSGKGKAGITSASSSCLFTETESFLKLDKMQVVQWRMMVAFWCFQLDHFLWENI